jgi:dTDP-glucose pyrophosphorylase
MIIVIPMAGHGRRFRERGYSYPKFMIEAKGTPLFDWALVSLRSFFADSRFIFVAREGFDFIRSRSACLGIRDFSVVQLESETDGQGTTVLLGLKDERQARPLLVFNIDTYVDPRRVDEARLPTADAGWLQLFEKPGNHWSFARLNPAGKVVEVAEKKRISELACTGLYGFGSARLFQEAYRSGAASVKADRGEVYVAPLYNQLLLRGLSVGAQVVQSHDVEPLGTPEEVSAFESGGCQWPK